MSLILENYQREDSINFLIKQGTRINEDLLLYTNIKDGMK